MWTGTLPETALMSCARCAVMPLFLQIGFRLAEIRQLLATGDESSWKDLGRAKYGQIDRQIAHLRWCVTSLSTRSTAPAPIYSSVRTSIGRWHWPTRAAEAGASGGF
jgi:hypothetical protein